MQGSSTSQVPLLLRQSTSDKQWEAPSPRQHGAHGGQVTGSHSTPAPSHSNPNAEQSGSVVILLSPAWSQQQPVGQEEK
jgi:hypothetical protein